MPSGVLPQVAELVAAREEHVEPAPADDAALDQDDDLVGAAEGGAAVGDGQDGRAVELGQAVREPLLGQCARGWATRRGGAALGEAPPRSSPDAQVGDLPLGAAQELAALVPPEAL